MTIKSYVQLESLAKKCNCDVADLLHHAGLGKLRLSLPFYGKVPAKVGPLNGSDLDLEKVVEYPDLGVFDLHLQDAIALAENEKIAVEDIFSPCGNWCISFHPARPITISDVVVRVEEADAFNGGDAFSVQISDSERSRLLRLIGGMALLIASKEKIYTLGSKPNFLQIGEAVRDVIMKLPDADLHGLGKTNAKEAISEGVKLLTMLKK